MPKSPAFPEPAARLPGEAEMLAAVVADPADDTAELAYADWLEERDDPRGPYLRKALAAARAGKKLPAAKFAHQPWRDLVGLTLVQKIHAAGLAAHADKILRLALPAVAVTSARAAEAKLPFGASKFGGGPDLPPGAEWPVFEGRPHAFLAQFNLAELSASFACRELPNAGLLSVFYAPDEEDDRDSDPKGSFGVFHFTGGAKLSRRLPSDNAFRSCRLTFAEALVLPDLDSPWRKDLGFGNDDELGDAYQVDVAGFVEGTEHRVLGYPAPVQGDILGKKTVRHLLTIGSDDNAGWMWGDGGALYFTLSEPDLKAGRFDRVRLEMQCD